MAENLVQFTERTMFVYHRLNTEERFYPDMDVSAKVGSDSELLPFYGDTVIFDLDDDAKQWLLDVQNILYAHCERYTLLSKCLTEESFHITLHDLTCRRPEAVHEILGELEAREKKVNERLDAFREEYPKGVCVQAMAMMNMVSKSAVLTFEPATEADCAALMDMYERLHEVVPIKNGLTPHVTIGYYRPDENGYGEDVTQALQNTFDEVKEKYQGKQIALSMDKLRYSCFTSMNRYCTREEMLQTLAAR